MAPNRGGIISGVIRFACHVPLGLQGFGALANYSLIKSHTVLQKYPNGGSIYTGEKLAGIAGVFAFAWNFSMWIPTIFAPPPLLFFFGIVDAGIVVCLGIAAILQSKYAPHSEAPCKTLRIQPRVNGSLGFFQLSESLNGTLSSGQDTCRDYNVEWTLAIVITVLYAVSALSNILMGGFGTLATRSTSMSRSSPSSPRKRSFGSGCLVCALLPFMAVLNLIFLGLPRPIQSRLRYVSRYLAKGRRALSDSESLKLSTVRSRARSKGGKEKGQSVARILSFDILALVARDLHYADIMNLSLASKTMRQTIFPETESSDERKGQLRLRSCRGSQKSACWVCNIQICEDCQTNRTFKESRVSYHAQLCKVHCSDCYYSRVCKTKMDYSPCGCIDQRENRTETANYYYGWSSHRGSSDRAESSRPVCSNCQPLSSEVIESIRERRDRAELKHLVKQPLTCFNCSTVLKAGGPRWWLCSICHRECVAKAHPAWTPKAEV